MNQREIPIFQAAPAPEMVPVELMKMCRSKLDAIRLCVQLSRLTHSTIQDELGIDKGHWTRMMQGRAHFPTNKEGELMRLCGNYAPLQFEAAASGFELHAIDDKAQRIAALEAQLAAARRAA